MIENHYFSWKIALFYNQAITWKCFFLHAIQYTSSFSEALYQISNHCVSSRRTWMRACGRKTDNVNPLLVPGRRAWMINVPELKNPISIVNKIAGYNIWRQNLAWYEILTNKTCKWSIGDPDFKCTCLAERWVPGKMMCAFTSWFCRASDKIFKGTTLPIE